MRQETRNILKFDELSTEAQEKAVDKWRSITLATGDIHWLSEMFDSLKGLIEACHGVEIKDYSLGNHRGYFLSLSFTEDAEDLRGPRAMAWLENNLLDGLRVGYKASNRWELSKYGVEYRAGHIKPGPFTGIYSDELFLNALTTSVSEGCTLREAFEGLADTYAELEQQEIDEQTSEEYITDTILANGYEFLEDGTLY